MLKQRKWQVGDWVEGQGWIGPIVEIYWDRDPNKNTVTFECCNTGIRSTAHMFNLRLWKHQNWMLLHLGCNGDHRPGFLNLDKAYGWDFETGLYQFPTGSVAGITISHAIQCVRHSKLREVFRQFARILQVGGALRITDDETIDPASSRCGKRAPGTLWDVGLEPTMGLMAEVGLSVRKLHGDETCFTTYALMINHRKGKDFPFFCEGLKLR